MTRRLVWITAALVAATACSDGQKPQAGPKPHFLQTCDRACPAPYACICGTCTLQCGRDELCREHAASARCTVAVAVDGDAQCAVDDPVCDAACQRPSDCNALGAGYECVASRCRIAPGPDAGEPDASPPAH